MGVPPGAARGSVVRYIFSQVFIVIAQYKLVTMDIWYWDQNPGIHTRPDIPLTAIPLNRKRNGITDPGSGIQNRPCAANVWSMRPRVVTTSADPRRAPMVGSFPLLPRLTGPHAQSTPTPLRNLALRSCSFPTRLRPRTAASTAFQS